MTGEDRGRLFQHGPDFSLAAYLHSGDARLAFRYPRSTMNE
jgi:hypothetical protein